MATDNGGKFEAQLEASQCSFCKHNGSDWNCTAFPEEIPDEILSNEFDHRLPHPGDNGVRFEPNDAEDARLMVQVMATVPGVVALQNRLHRQSVWPDE